ncbi:hypothetical protein Scep_026804 [Stephania cephalantha]|uniref:Uncharacterized protein n=1 Tax=Stephania cephalantha TaxID=152367 RepID=A0AAP0EKV2_9MAGN
MQKYVASSEVVVDFLLAGSARQQFCAHRHKKDRTVFVRRSHDVTRDQLATKDSLDLNSRIDYGVSKCVVREKGNWYRLNLLNQKDHTKKGVRLLIMHSCHPHGVAHAIGRKGVRCAPLWTRHEPA